MRKLEYEKKNQFINFYRVNICVLNHHLLLGLEGDRAAVFWVQAFLIYRLSSVCPIRRWQLLLCSYSAYWL